MTVGILGAGTVGNQIIHLLTEQTDDFTAHSGARLEITGAAVRDVNTPRGFAVPQGLLTDDAIAAVTDNDLVIEFIGRVEPVRTLILVVLKAGASVVTGNKALIAAYGPEPCTTTAAVGTNPHYEAAVVGAIPVVYAPRGFMVGDRVTSVFGIVSGTTSYILDEMNTKGLSFRTVLAAAQELSYAKAGPTAGVDGLDAAVEVAITVSLVFHTRVGLDNASAGGVRGVTTNDIREAHASDCELKLSAITQRRDDEHVQGVSVRVHSTLIPNDHPLASAHGAYNAVLAEVENAGCLMFYGQRAGGALTASTVLSDVVVAAAHRVHSNQAPREPSYVSLWVLGPEATITYYQIQLHSGDAVGSLAAMASVPTENEVSTNSVCQSAYVASDGSYDQAIVTFVTHPAPVLYLDAVVGGLRDSDQVAEIASIQRVEGE